MTHIANHATVTLRKTEPGDLETLFHYQADEAAAHMAAFISEQWKDKAAYLEKWNKLLSDGANDIYTIISGNEIVGSISTWYLMDELHISYWIGKEYWGKGIATKALQQFLAIATERPLFGRVAFDNIGSAKVLMKCGFRKIKEETFYAFARQKEIIEIILLLES